MTRPRIIVLALVCMPIAALLSILLLGHAVFGSKVRALRMEIALDQCGNAALGGSEDETISSCGWAAYQAGKRWGRIAVPQEERR